MHLPPPGAASYSHWSITMATKINQVPAKRPETETPTVISNSTDPEQEEHKKMERMADRAAHKANKTEQQYDEDHNTFSI